MIKPVKNVLVMSNYDPFADEVMFTSDRGSWNVTRAQRDCDAGMHGNPWLLNVEECYHANAAVEVDMEKVFRYMKNPKILARPGIAVMEDGASWFIEGHHRLRALYLAGIKEFASYVINDPTRYIVWFNGRRQL
jgi:hypothetical protein